MRKQDTLKFRRNLSNQSFEGLPLIAVTRTILYVDDEPALCRAFERALRGPGMKIVTTTSAPHAVELLDRERFDVIATDYRMPEINGIEVLREARARAPGARRLLVSGRVDGEVGEDVLAEAAVDGVVIKPWSLDELRRVVRLASEVAVLSRDRRIRDVQLVLAALELRHADTAHHSRRVARRARAAAEAVGVQGDELTALDDAALLHAAAKIGALDAQLAGADCLGPGPLVEQLSLLPLSARAARILAAADRYDLTKDAETLRRDAPDLADAIVAVTDEA
jgi:response regulator RpfG family c-di-GMP phosphodiesterase